MGKPSQFGVCPYETSQRLLSGKWSIYILFLLSKGPLRFNEMLRRMPGNMTHTSLTRQLKLLEEEGLIIRTDFGEVPPRVEYSLSEVGSQFDQVLDALEIWGRSYIDFLHKNRA